MNKFNKMCEILTNRCEKHIGNLFISKYLNEQNKKKKYM